MINTNEFFKQNWIGLSILVIVAGLVWFSVNPTGCRDAWSHWNVFREEQMKQSEGTRQDLQKLNEERKNLQSPQKKETK